MKHGTRFLIFVENLTFLSWFFIFPFVLFNRLRNNRSGGRIYYVDSTGPGRILAKMTMRFLGFDIVEFAFRQFDLRNESGDSLRLKVSFGDLPLLKDRIVSDSSWKRIFSKLKENPVLRTFLIKQAILGGSSRLSLEKILFLILAVEQKKINENGFDQAAVLFLHRRLWMRSISEYAEICGIKTVFILDGKINSKELLMNVLGLKRIKSLRNLFYAVTRKKRFSVAGKPRRFPQLGVEYYGQLHLDDPTMHSDFFFFPASQIPGKNMTVVFSVPSDPLDEAKLSEIKRHDMAVAVIHPRATTLVSEPVWGGAKRPQPSSQKKAVLDISGNFPAHRWLQREIRNYFEERDDWQQFFEAQHIKIFTTWFKYTSSHCVMADALRQAGGIMTVYQRAFEEYPCVDMVTASDVVFAFSKESREIEKRNRSFIPYHVVVGYLADYRFPLLRKEAKRIREHLQKSGARHILAYFDENSLDDARWHFGHDATRENYTFLLQKVLQEPEFGLVLKPKAFTTLTRRLGDVARLLEEAEHSGRCFIFKEGAIHVSYPPAMAALAADIAVHGHLYAATAGMEAALAGVPTLLLDREGWSISKFYRLGKGRVVFTDWDALWSACKDYWRASDCRDSFGDWSPLFEELDPFRDGRAAERMGIYLKWMLEGYKDGRLRTEILAQAAERYSAAWGQDKIVENLSFEKVEEIA